MLKSSARLLQMLSLLQARRDWAGADLAARLGVSTRTVRTDIERLRSLGYPIIAARGVAGGYRLGPGSTMPPLLLDDEEAIAVAVGLRTAVTTGVSGIEESSLSALSKLEQVLPARLRHQVANMRAATVSVGGGGAPGADPDALSAIAAAIRAQERLRFDYTTHDGAAGRREVEPYRIVNWGRRWYLLGWDLAREDWRTFRIDRMEPKTPTGPRFVPKPLGDKDAAAYVQRGAGSAVWRYAARVLVDIPAEAARAKLPPAVTVTPAGEDRCEVEVGSDTPHMLALYLGLLDADFSVIEPPELAAALSRLAKRYARAARIPSPDAQR